jgi:hypothetical protein
MPDPSPGVAAGTGIGVVATMDSIRCSGVAQVQRSALVARSAILTVAPSVPPLDPRSGPRFLVRLRGGRRPVDRPVRATTEGDGYCPTNVLICRGQGAVAGFGLTRALQLMPYGVECGGPAVVPRGLRRAAWRRRRAAAGPRRLPSTSKLCGPAFARRARSRAQVAAVSRYRDRRQDEQRAGPNPLREAPSARHPPRGSPRPSRAPKRVTNSQVTPETWGRSAGLDPRRVPYYMGTRRHQPERHVGGGRRCMAVAATRPTVTVTAPRRGLFVLCAAPTTEEPNS